MSILKRLALFLAFSLLLLPWPAAASQDFDSWLSEVAEEAMARGVSRETVERALAGLNPNPRILELEAAQPEFVLSTREYLDRVVSEQRKLNARRLLEENRALLKGIEARYGVPARYLVALWGIETNFGALTGGAPVIQSLATLAYSGRRPGFFRGELLNALTILDEGHVSMERMSGSWAGAMGQVQFIPSTFRRYAVDFDRDGRKDIWGSKADALASAANYLKELGWNPDEGWGERVTVPGSFNLKMAGMDTIKTLREWKKLGLRGIDGPPDRRASLILPDGPDGPGYLVFNNFRVLMKWNRSVSFALAVGMLAHSVKG